MERGSKFADVLISSLLHLRLHFPQEFPKNDVNGGGWVVGRRIREKQVFFCLPCLLQMPDECFVLFGQDVLGFLLERGVSGKLPVYVFFHCVQWVLLLVFLLGLRPGN